MGEGGGTKEGRGDRGGGERVRKGKKGGEGGGGKVTPATPEVYSQCLDEGIIKIFTDAGAVVSTPTCGPCLGGYMGILAAGESAVATTNRNFVGRMGSTESKVYLASPYVAAASAVTGYISAPWEV